MKDLSQYHYSELFDMVNHINPFKYPDRIEAVEKEIRMRKEQGKIPERLVPETDWTPLKFWKRKSPKTNAESGSV